jgi:hypothetical protein
VPPRLAAVAGAVVLALCLAGCGSTSTRAPDVQFGPFAGYLWGGDVRQVGAVVAVPTIDDLTRPGFAGTWIGAEGSSDPRTQRAAFFQVGVNEVGGAEFTLSGDSHYYAFWSSTALGFHPRRLFEVQPGDPVQLSIRVAHNRLVLYARDRHTGVHRTVHVALDAADVFNVAVWHQEDVTDGRTGTPFPYPALSRVRFSALRVDGRKPRVDELTLSWMSTASAIYGPAPSGSDGFSVGQIHPSHAALEYERLAVPQDLASYLFDAQLLSWSSSTSSSKIRAGCRRYAHVLAVNISQLQRYRWPASARDDIERLIRSSREQIALLRRLAAQTTSFLRQFKQRRFLNIGPMVRAELHMAIFDPSTGAIADYVKAHSG